MSTFIYYVAYTLLYVLPVFLLICALVWVVNFIGFVVAKEEHYDAIIKNKYYLPDTNAVSPGIGFGQNGAVPTVVFTGQDEKFIIEVKGSNRKTEMIDVDHDCFDDLKKGQKIEVLYKVSKWTESVKTTGVRY